MRWCARFKESDKALRGFNNLRVDLSPFAWENYITLRVEWTKLLLCTLYSVVADVQCYIYMDMAITLYFSVFLERKWNNLYWVPRWHEWDVCRRRRHEICVFYWNMIVICKFDSNMDNNVRKVTSFFTKHDLTIFFSSLTSHSSPINIILFGSLYFQVCA